MRNKICGHVYSYKGIQHHLKSNKQCPMPGCSNTNVTMSQLEEDEEMTMKIRRFQFRTKNANRFIFSQTVDDDE